MSKSKNVDTALKIISTLTKVPKSIASLAEELGDNYTKIKWISGKLRKENIISFTTSSPFGLISNGSCSIERVSEAFGYHAPGVERRITCKFCSEVEYKICKGKDLYVNREGMKWRFNKCPHCWLHELRNKSAYADPIEMTTRKCQQCKSFLPVTRYFECVTCKPHLGDDMLEFSVITEGASYHE